MRLPSRIGHLLIAAMMVVVLGATTFVVMRQTDDPVMISYWWFGMLVILFCALAFVIGRRYLKNEPASGRVVCIVPTYNEPTEHLHACIEAILSQDWPVDIHVIDDGSVTPAEMYHHERVIWHRQTNRGKRGAQVTVLRWIAEHYGKDYYSYVLTVDSDSRPYPNATCELLRAMNQDYNPFTGERRIWATTGMIYIRNYADSWVSRAADMDIGSSCVMMRASRSMLGALETTSGALAMYPAELLYDHLDEYEVECGTGDDRWLALRALMRGEVVAVQEAVVETEMPTTLKATRKQRLRWARSWWWMLPFVFRDLSPKQLISPLYGIVQLILAPVMLVWAVVGLVMTAGQRYESSYGVLFMYLGAYLAVRFGLSGFYLIGRPNMPRREKAKSFFIGTLQAIWLNVSQLMPLRYWALTQLNNAQWDNRGVVVQKGPRHAYAGMEFNWRNPRYLVAAGMVLFAAGVGAYTITGGSNGPAQWVTNPQSADLFNDRDVFERPSKDRALPSTPPSPARTTQTAEPAPRPTAVTIGRFCGPEGAQGRTRSGTRVQCIRTDSGWRWVRVQPPRVTTPVQEPVPTPSRTTVRPPVPRPTRTLVPRPSPTLTPTPTPSPSPTPTPTPTEVIDGGTLLPDELVVIPTP